MKPRIIEQLSELAETAFAMDCAVDLDLRGVPSQDYDEAKAWAEKKGYIEHSTENSFTLPVWNKPKTKSIPVSIQRVIDRDYLKEICPVPPFPSIYP